VPPVLVVVVLAALVALATALGLAWRASQGRMRRAGDRADAPRVDPRDRVPLAPRLTLLQFSSEVCAPCSATAHVLDALADERDGVSHVELDISEHPDLAARFRVLATPTTFLVDPRGRVVIRITGTARRHELEAELDRLLAA
jgi:thiol-disulfide isomerase/thioredoxin